MKEKQFRSNKNDTNNMILWTNKICRNHQVSKRSAKQQDEKCKSCKVTKLIVGVY